MLIFLVTLLIIAIIIFNEKEQWKPHPGQQGTGYQPCDGLQMAGEIQYRS